MIDVDELRRKAHEAPMNPVGKDHKGNRYLLNHSYAWAKTSRDWCEERKRQLEEIK